MMPDTELSVVGECVAQKPAIVGGTGEGDGFLLCLGIDDGFYMIAESPRSRIEIDAAEIIVYGVERNRRFRRVLRQVALWKRTGGTKI